MKRIHLFLMIVSCTVCEGQPWAPGVGSEPALSSTSTQSSLGTQHTGACHGLPLTAGYTVPEFHRRRPPCSELGSNRMLRVGSLNSTCNLFPPDVTPNVPALGCEFPPLQRHQAGGTLLSPHTCHTFSHPMALGKRVQLQAGWEEEGTW